MIDETKNLDLSPLDDNINSLAQQVIDEGDVDKTKDLVALFNWNLSKKNVARLLKLNNLFDAVSDQMVERFEKKPDQFSNSDLLDYMKAVQGAIDSSSKYLSETEEPPAIVNNTQINVNVVDSIDKDIYSKKPFLTVILNPTTIKEIRKDNKNIDYSMLNKNTCSKFRTDFQSIFNPDIDFCN